MTTSSASSATSPVHQAFFRRLGNRLGQVGQTQLPAFVSWVEDHVVLPSGPFRFDGHSFLRDIYADDHEHRVIRKASQVGATTHVLARCSYLCRNRFRNGVIYFMPTDRHVSELAKGIVDPFFELNPGLLTAGSGAVNSVTVKRLGFAHLYFRGLKTTMSAKTIPADMVVFDEDDEIAPHARRSAMQRVAHSPYGYKDELSIPSIPGYGIDEIFQQSDQRHWMVRCSACRRQHVLEEEFPACLVRRGVEVLRVCTHCGKTMDVNSGQWVAKRQGQRIHGYALSQVFAPWIDPAVLLNEFEEGKNLDVFFNERLGLPYVESENELKREQVLQLCGKQPRARSGRDEVVAGIDQGKDLHVWLWAVGAGGAPRCVGLEVFRDEEKARDYLRQFRLVAGVIDALPETRVAQKFIDWFPGKFFRQFYRERAEKEMVRWDETRSVVIVDRTHTLDNLYTILREAGAELPRQDVVVEEAATHFSRLKKKRVKDEDETVRYEFIRTGDDHFAHAANSGLIALDRFKVRHVQGAAYRAMDDSHTIEPVNLAKLADGNGGVKHRIDVHFALVPHDRLPWVGVWLAVDQAGVMAVFREEEFDGVTLATFARRLAAAEATDPKGTVSRYLPRVYADLAHGEKELTFLERLEEVDSSLEFEPVDCPDSLAVVKIREAMAPRQSLDELPGFLVARDCAAVIEALRMHRPGVKPETDAAERLAMFHQAVGMIVVQDPAVRVAERRRR